MTTARRCGAPLKSGGECRSVVLLRDGRCWQHSGISAGKAKEASARGGAGGGSRAKIGPAPDASLATSAGRQEWLRYAKDITLAKRTSLAQAETLLRIVKEAREEQLTIEMAAELQMLSDLATRAQEVQRRRSFRG
jgi:hypothetical protein